MNWMLILVKSILPIFEGFLCNQIDTPWESKSKTLSVTHLPCQIIITLQVLSDAYLSSLIRNATFFFVHRTSDTVN